MNRNTKAIVIEYEGRDVTFRELSSYIFRTRGYRVDSRTLLKRHQEGRGGDDLVAPTRGTPRGEKTGGFPTNVVQVAIAGWGART